MPAGKWVIVREFPLKIPAGVQFFVRLGLGRTTGWLLISSRPPRKRLALFRIDPIQDGQV